MVGRLYERTVSSSSDRCSKGLVAIGLAPAFFIATNMQLICSRESDITAITSTRTIGGIRPHVVGRTGIQARDAARERPQPWSVRCFRIADGGIGCRAPAYAPRCRRFSSIRTDCAPPTAEEVVTDEAVVVAIVVVELIVDKSSLF